MSVTLGKQFLAIWSNLALGRDMSVKGLPGDAEFGAKFGDRRFRLPHCRLGETQLGRRHLERSSAMSTPRTRRHEACSGALDNQLALKFSKTGKYCEDQAAVSGGGVD